MKRFLSAILVCAGLCGSGLSGLHSDVQAQGLTPLPLPDTQDFQAFLGAPVSGKSLDRTRGRGGISTPNIDGLFQNTPNAPTVMNGVGGNAFSGSSGIVSIVQNSGNNVTIDNTVNLSLKFIK